MSPGGLSASAAATSEKPTTAARVHSNSRDEVLKGATTFRYSVDAATSNTLSIDDMAAARIAMIRKSLAHSGNTDGSLTREGTIRSVSVTSGRIRWV